MPLLHLNHNISYNMYAIFLTSTIVDFFYFYIIRQFMQFCYNCSRTMWYICLWKCFCGHHSSLSSVFPTKLTVTFNPILFIYNITFAILWYYFFNHNKLVLCDIITPCITNYLNYLSALSNYSPIKSDGYFKFFSE